jgi:hypothetical protein
MKSILIRVITPLAFVSCLSVGCSRTNHSPVPTIDPQVKQQLEAPINCATAKQDIATLEDERASVAKQIISGARSVIPFSAAAGIVMGDAGDRFEVATGEYNEKIDAKISQIRRKCVAYLGEV